MKFWVVKCRVKTTGEAAEFLIASDENAKKSKIKKDLSEVWPEYEKISLKKGTKPPEWSLFEGVR